MTLLLCDAEREPAVVRRIASSLSAEAHLSKRARLMLPWELGRLAEPISEFWNGRGAEAEKPSPASRHAIAFSRGRRSRLGRLEAAEAVCLPVGVRVRNADALPEPIATDVPRLPDR